VLLLPAMLLVNGKQWGQFGGTKYSVVRLLKIVTAFTIGHSITLLIGAFGWLRLPTQPVEILIAFSILISAIHAIYPIFPGKEIYIAAGFGLVHGLAFASVLANLNLDAGAMALSILGFNIGIELMQLFVVIITVPWLILLSKTAVYKWVRIAGAIFAAIASLAWIAERSWGKANFITILIQHIVPNTYWAVILLAVSAFAVFAWQINKNKNLL
jgi:HupE / UreJ protein